MKDYSLRNEKIKLIHALATSIGEHMTELFENGYNQGYEDGKADTPFTDTEEAEKTAYERGLNDAWECARKMCLMSSAEERLRAFDVSGNHLVILSALTAPKAIEKLKAYEERQKQTEEIKVGYEVYNLDPENKRIVTAIDGNKAIQLCSNGKYTVDNIDTLHWTGREDLRIKKVLENIKPKSADVG